MNKLNVVHYKNKIGDFLLLKNDAIAQNMLSGIVWEEHLVHIASKLINPGDTVIDAGANAGIHTVTFANLVGDNGKVIAFEPLRIIYQQLCANVFINGLTNVYPYNVALGNIDISIEMQPVNYFANWVNIGDTSATGGGEEVVCVTLDMYHIKPNFIKIDVQGYELKLLDGAEITIKKHNPYLFIEIENNQLAKFGISPKILIDRIKKMEYDVFQIVNAYPCDHLCVPKHKRDSIKLIEKSDLYTIREV